MAKKIVTIVGARPQFIKAAVVSRAFGRQDLEINEVMIHTGQHYDAEMSDVFFDELDIPLPNYNLGIGGGTHGQNTGRMIEKIEEVLLGETPDMVLVFGDTDSTLAGALAAIKLHIKVAHVEAGLRSFNRRMPEEINRILTDHSTDLLFTPTDIATRNLYEEGIEPEKVYQVGDVMYDAALYYSGKAEKTSNILDNHNLEQKAYVLATIHRAENTDEKDRISNILEGLASSVIPVVWPIHPRAAKMIDRYNLDVPEIVKTINPVGYLDMVMLEKHARLIMTDSGGVQKEAYFHNIPCVTLRNETEWVELVEEGVNNLVGADTERIRKSLSNTTNNVKMSRKNLYGDGTAGVKIASLVYEN